MLNSSIENIKHCCYQLSSVSSHFLKTLLAPIYTNFYKFFQKVPKNACFDLFFKSLPPVQKYRSNRVFIVIGERSENQFDLSKKNVDKISKTFVIPTPPPRKNPRSAPAEVHSTILLTRRCQMEDFWGKWTPCYRKFI